MKYLKIKDWDRWQTFRKDRGTPPWIKVYRNLFSNPDWMELTDQEKGQLVSMWIAAADKSGKLSINPKIIQKVCFLDEPPNLQRFKDLGFIDGNMTTEDDNHMPTVNNNNDNHMPTVNGKHDQPETETETETELNPKGGASKKDRNQNLLSQNKKELIFEDRWLAYAGEKDNKKTALRHWNGKIQSQEDVDNYDKAVLNYYAIVAHSRGNGFPDRRLKGGKTWFNNFKSYIDQEPPQEKTADEIQREQKWTESELKEKCISQLKFVEEEMDAGEVREYQWFYIALDQLVMEYEQRFRYSPFGRVEEDSYTKIRDKMRLKEEA